MRIGMSDGASPAPQRQPWRRPGHPGGELCMELAVGSDMRFSRPAPHAVFLAAGVLLSAASSALAGSSPTCVPTSTSLCLSDARFRVEVQFRPPGGSMTPGQAVSLTSDTGYFWFFQAANIELIVKALNGCAINGHEWVFAGGLTNVELDIAVTDTVTNAVSHYTNPAGTAFQPVQDTAAFVCSAATTYDWPQFGFDAAHSGNNPLETTVSRGNVASLAPVFSVRLPEIEDGAPVLAAGVATSSG